MNVHERSWQRHIQELAAFKNHHGHTVVPRLGKTQRLFEWLNTQRYLKRKGRLSADRRQQLEHLSVAWDLLPLRWETRLQQLIAFHRQHGHYSVPKDRECKTLNNWVVYQRSHRQRLARHQKERLDQVGFPWKAVPSSATWDGRIAELVAFKKRFGHCRVPFRWKENRKLGIWVQTCRRYPNRLSPQRRRQLNQLGFVWQVIHWSRRLEVCT